MTSDEAWPPPGWRTVGKLREALADPRLRADDKVERNAAGNLLVVRDGEDIGYIDVLNGEVVLNEG